jgi:hypothetical protein
MATEGPLLHDGGQCVAAANYSNTAGLAGPGGSGQFYAVAKPATTNRAVALAAATGVAVYGILQNKPLAGDPADIGFFGISKALAAGTIAVGADVMTNASGLMVAWTSGSGYAKAGMALESAVNGQIFTLFVYGPGGPLALT